MAEHSSIDSVSEPSGTAKTNFKSDNIFSIMNDHRQLISPGYDNNISGFQASIENINVGGGAMSNAPVTHTPEVVTPDIYNMLLQNQLYIQTLMKNQNSRTDTTQSSTKVNPRQSATMAGPRKVVKSKPKKDDYQSQLDSLFDNDMNNNQTKNISAPSELYSDISSDESYDKDDEACSENEVDNDIEKAENEDVLESMKDFISSDEKTGPKINSGLASYMNQGLRTRVNEEKYKDLTKKYDKPANVSSIKVPRVNIGIWKQMTPRNKDVGVKLQRLQNLLSKTACPLMYMMDMFVDKSSKKEGMSREELQAYAVTCRDTPQQDIQQEEKQRQKVDHVISDSDVSTNDHLIDLIAIKLQNIPNNFIWGKISKFFHRWKELTSDYWILNIIKGYQLEFENIPTQLIKPYPLVFSSEENEYVQKEIDKFISKTIIQPVTPIKDQGEDFRPEFRDLEITCSILSEKSILALTATANQKIVDDVFKYLTLLSETEVIAVLPNRCVTVTR
ncbi:recQ [Mytilus coruscus]|uniref:RecQ n=1 Tax=Mytilus coruscus TaxID=42192 RepID=A0A6J8EH84_MYTCO|nr:recQ [Mytilus coruscus]